MKTYLENELAKDAVQFWDETLEAQVHFTGKVELAYLAQKIKEAKPSRVVDIGTGNGAFLLRLASQFPKIEFVGIDHNRGLLDLFEKRIQQSRPSNVTVQEALFDSKGLAGPCEFILARYTLGHVSDRLGFCQGVFNSLKPGGRFYSLDGSFTLTHGLASGLWKQVIEKYLDVLPRFGTDIDVGLEMHRLLSQARFEQIDSALRFATPETAGDEALKTVTLKTLTMFHKQFPEIVPAQFIEKVDKELLHDKGTRFPLHMGIIQTEAFRPVS